MAEKKIKEAAEKKEKKKRGKGQPKTFESGDQLIELFESFCEYIRANDYDELPSQSEFVRYLKGKFKETNRRTIYNALNDYFPNIKNDFMTILSDTLVAGAAKGKYKEATIIFALKNWCKWTDRQELDQNLKGSVNITIEGQVKDWAK